MNRFCLAPAGLLPNLLFLLLALLFKDCENLLKVLFLNLRDLLRFFSAVVTSPARPGTGLSAVVAQEDFSALFRLRISLHIVQLFGEHMFVRSEEHTSELQ